MSRSFALERIRINIEIFCESMGDFLATSFGSLRKPLTMLAGMALVMTLRSARKGVQKMKRGGLTAGAHDASYKANYGYGKAASGYGSKATTLGGSKTAPGYGAFATGNSASTGYGRATAAASYTPGGAAASGYSGGGTAGYSSSTSTGYGVAGGASSYGASSNYGAGGGYGANTGYGAAGSTATSSGVVGGPMMSSQSPRALADLLDRHGAAVRVMDAHAFKDFGGVHEFYGQVETLQAYEGAGVVEKVLQSPGMNKVLVVDGGGNVNVAVFSKAAAVSAKQNGWKGVIIHGAIRDAKAVGETPIGCKAMASNPNRGKATTGSKGVVLNIAGLQITAGMWVYADKDGIAFSDTELTAGGGAINNGVNTGMNAVGGGYSQGGTTGSVFTNQASPGGYGAGAQAGGYVSQTGGTATGYGSQTGGAATGYGSSGGYGSSTTGYGAQQGGYGSAASTGYGLTAGATPGASGYGSSNNYPYSHGGLRPGSSASHRDVCMSTAVYLSMLSLVLFPLELI